MGVRIIQVDLAQPLPTVQTAADGRRGRNGDGGCDALWLLVKLGPQPIGWVRFDDPRKFGKEIGPDQLLKLTNDALSREIQAAAGERAHEPITLKRTPSFSIVICTRGGDRDRDRADTALQRQLASIAKLQYPSRDYEVIVVDGSGESSAAALRGLCAAFPGVRYAHDPRPGINYARNSGWQLARGEIVAYLEVGAIVDPDWLTALAANYVDPQVDCVTGIALPREIETPVHEQFARYFCEPRPFRRRVYRPGTWNTSFPLDAGRFGGGANLSVSRERLGAMGGFDVALNGAGGVFDVVVRVLCDGGMVAYDPRAIVFAAAPRSEKDLRANRFDAACGFVSFGTKYAHHLELANHALKLLTRWFRQRAVATLRWDSLARDMALAELLGGVAGLGGYRRAMRRARKDLATFAKRAIRPTELLLRSAPQTPPAPTPARARSRGRKAAA